MMSPLLLSMAVFLADPPASAVADADSRIAAAHEHRQASRYAEALEAYAALAEDESLTARQQIDAAIGLSLAEQETGAWQAATETLRRAVAGPHPSAGLWSRLAEIEYLQGRYDAARLAVQSALQLDADNPRAHLVSGHLARETGQLDQALAEYQWCVRYYNRAQPKDADTLLVIAAGSLEYARWKSVSNIFNFVVNTLCPDALKADPHCWQAHLLSGGLLLEKYNQGQALPEFNKALAINPQAPPVLAALGAAALQNLNLEQADEYADRALAVNPLFPEALLLKADVALAGGDTAAARTFIDTAKQVDAADPRTRAREALACLLDDGVPPDDELLTVFLHLDAIDDLDLPARSRFSEILIDVARTNPRPGYFLAIIGEALDAHRQYDAAERFYRQAMNVMPQLSAPQTNLGMLSMRTGRIEEARRILDQAFRADPFHVRVSNMRKVLDVLEGYDTVASEHFVIRRRIEPPVGRGHVRIPGKHLPRATDRYGFEPPTRCSLNLQRAKGQALRMVQRAWSTCRGFRRSHSTGMIVALASPTDREPSTGPVVRHEFMHILTLQQTGFNIPHWYTEALAVREEGLDFPDEWQELLIERFTDGDVFNLRTVNSGFQRPEGPGDWTLAYCQSHLYARYMVERFGDDSLLKLLEAYQRGLDTPAAIPEVFGVDLADFEAGYTAYLGRLVADIQPRRSPPLPNLAAAEAAQADESSATAAGRYAFALMLAERYRDAGRLVAAAVELDPRQPDAAYVRARFALGRQDQDTAIERLVEGLDEQQPHSEVLSLLARLRLDAGENAEAARLYEIGTQHFPLEDRYLNGLAVALWRLDDAERLRPILELAAARDFDNAAVRKKLARIAADEDRPADALHWAQDALYVDILDPETHLILAQAHIATNNPTRAAHELNIVLALDSENNEARTLLDSLSPAD